MSPMNSVSPNSATETSPISPVDAEALFTRPATPILMPVTRLPRLVTSFQDSCINAGDTRRMPIQFQFPTPSPLSLDQQPLTAVCKQGYNGCHESNHTSRQQSISSCHFPDLYDAPAGGGSPQDDGAISIDMGAPRSVPALPRRNANEGLERLLTEFASSTTEREGGLSLFPSILPLPHVEKMPFDTYPEMLEQATNELEPCASMSPLLTPRPRARSPISKQRSNKTSQHRRRLTRPDASSLALVVRRPLPPRAEQLRSEAAHAIAHLSHPLVPLVSVINGLSHPNFPCSILQFHVLTHDQLDSLARWYHQTTDAGRERWMYPCPIEEGKAWCKSTQDVTWNSMVTDHNNRTANASAADSDIPVTDLDTKRRRWGRFIGLRGCESPVVERESPARDAQVNQESIDELGKRIDREWREALRRAREADMLREKTWRGRF